jgi:hypothetical protein
MAGGMDDAVNAVEGRLQSSASSKINTGAPAC